MEVEEEDGETWGRVEFDARRFFPWDGRSPVPHRTCDVPVPPRKTGGYRKGMIDLGPPVVPGGQELGLGSRNRRPAEARPGRAVYRERLGDWTDRWNLSPLMSASAKACHMAKRRVGV